MSKIANKEADIKCIKRMFDDEEGQNSITNLFGEVQYASGCFRDSSNKSYMKDFKQYCNSENKRGFTQSVLEIHNAFSHLSAFLYQNDPKDPFKNIDKAKNHLYRAIIRY